LQQILIQHANVGLVSTDYVNCGGLVAKFSREGVDAKRTGWSW